MADSVVRVEVSVRRGLERTTSTGRRRAFEHKRENDESQNAGRKWMAHPAPFSGLETVKQPVYIVVGQ